MVTISNIDLVMAALRSRLQRIAADKRADKTRAVRPSRLARNDERRRVEALAAMRQLPEEEFDRALVRAMLETELGEAVATDARFQRIVDHTTQVLRESPELRSAFRQIQSDQD
jgi:hypothetical protein